MSIDHTVTTVHQRLRDQTPLIQCITNYVSMDIAANVLNAVGASPAMVHDVHEAGDFAAVAAGVMVNIGTPSPPWVDGMQAAARVAVEHGTPWVLDPVAVGATRYRQQAAAALLEHRPTVIRGNASEIMTLMTAVSAGRGVDSDSRTEEAVPAADTLAERTGAAVAVTGTEDVVTDGSRHLRVRGGDPRMPLITALGCSLSAVTTACCAVESDPVVATAAALAIFAVAGERAGADAAGPGTLRWRFVDELANLCPADLTGRVVQA